MREVVLDTETTGLEPDDGHRIVEIGAVELINHVPSGRSYHQYINPERPVPREAYDIHGLGDGFLRPQPRFADIADAFLDFIADAPLVIHNASFDMRFLNAELGWMKRPALPMERAVDTLTLARRRFPGAPASLDALCRRFGVDNASRDKHGALLDSEILAEVYLQLIGGRQPDFALAPSARTPKSASDTATPGHAVARPAPLPPRLTAAEAAAHDAFVTTLGDDPLWRHFD